MATYTKSTNAYQGRYYKATLTQGTHDSEKGEVTISCKFESIGGEDNYYSAPATYIDLITPYETKRIYSHPKTMYPSSKSFPVAKGSTTKTATLKTDDDGNLTMSVKFHKDSMQFSNLWASFDHTGTFTIDQIPRQSLRIVVNGAWKRATPYVMVNGAWKRATAYQMVSGTWKRGN